MALNKIQFFLTLFFLSIFSFSTHNYISAQVVNSGYDYFLEGIREYNSGNIENGEKLLLESIKTDKSNDASYYYLGLINDEKGEDNLAEHYYRAACEADTSNFWYRMSLAKFYSKTNRIELASSLFEKLCSDFPSKSMVYYEMIDIYTNSNQIDKALDALDRIEKLRGVNEATGNARYQLLTMQGKYDEAMEYLESFIKEYPSPRVAFVLGDLYKSKYNDTLALKYYNQSLAMDPQYTPAYFGLAEVYRMTRQLNLFFKNINIFLADSDMNLTMKENYMKEVVFNPQFVQVFKPQIDTMINNIVSAHPEDTSALFLAGSYYIQTNRPDTGKVFYQTALEMYPDVRSVNMEYISLLYYFKDWEGLIAQIKRSLVYFPEDPFMMEILAISHWQHGEIDMAINTYNDIIKSLPKGSEMLLACYSALGDLYQLKGNLKKTYYYYDKALKINPLHNPVLNNYAYFLSNEGKSLKKALEMSKKTIKSEPDNPTYLDTYAWLLYLTGEYEDAKGYFKHAMLYGGKESAVILDHYADVLYALGESDLAFIYWEQASKMDTTLGIGEKIVKRKSEIKSR